MSGWKGGGNQKSSWGQERGVRCRFVHQTVVLSSMKRLVNFDWGYPYSQRSPHGGTQLRKSNPPLIPDVTSAGCYVLKGNTVFFLPRRRDYTKLRRSRGGPGENRPCRCHVGGSRCRRNPAGRHLGALIFCTHPPNTTSEALPPSFYAPGPHFEKRRQNPV